MNKIQELIQQKLALEIANKTLDETNKKLENINIINKDFKNTVIAE